MYTALSHLLSLFLLLLPITFFLSELRGESLRGVGDTNSNALQKEAVNIVVFVEVEEVAVDR